MKLIARIIEDTATAGLRELRGAIPEAVARGLNRTARSIEQRLLNEMERKLDRPTPFTLSAFALQRATASDQAARLHIKPWQWAYLRFAVEGGRVDKTVEPGPGARLNQYGNIPAKRRGLAGIAGRYRDSFVGDVRGTLGAWQREGRGGLRLIAAARRDAVRNPRLDLFGTAQAEAERRLERDIAQEIERLTR
jgi:hypothetical protein